MRPFAPVFVSGRGTESFVRRDGKWIHAGWHRDALARCT